MSSFLKKKKMKILVAEPSSAGRQEIIDVLKKSGYKDFTGVASLKEAVEIMEVEDVNWVITSMFSDDEYNALKFLKLCNSMEQLFGVRTTIFLNEEEWDSLEAAYVLGALSVHKKELTHSVIEGIVLDIDRRIEVNEGNECKVAASFFREYLMSISDVSKRYKLERELARTFRGDPYQLVNLGEAQLEHGKKEHGYASIKQSVLLEPDLEGRVNELVEKHFEDGVPDATAVPPINILHLDKVLVVDPDESVLNSVHEALIGLGVKEIATMNNGADAIEWLKENEDCGLILHEWRIPGVTGPAFLQRVRKSLKLLDVPLIVVSSLVNQDDVPLLNEMGVTGFVKKPIDHKQLLKNLFWAMKEFRQPSDLAHLEQKIHLLLEGGDIAGAEATLSEYLSTQTVETPQKEILQADFEFHRGNFEQAKKHASDALKTGGNSLFLLNLLGKSLMQLRDFTSALQCFEKARQMSPLNIERLCSIAELQQELGDNEASRAAIDQAKQVDEGSEQVVEAEAKLAIESGEVEEAKSLLEEVESIKNIIAYMNNRAVALARCGMVEGGIELYEKALASIPESKRGFRPVVKYNMSLAYIRADDTDEAISLLGHVIEFGESKVLDRAKSLVQKLEVAKEKGLPIFLSKGSEHKSQEEKSEEDSESVQSSSSEELFKNKGIVSYALISPGDFCLFRVYSVPKFNECSQSLLKGGPIRFSARGSIVRGETLGADKLNKQAQEEKT